MPISHNTDEETDSGRIPRKIKSDQFKISLRNAEIMSRPLPVITLVDRVIKLPFSKSSLWIDVSYQPERLNKLAISRKDAHTVACAILKLRLWFTKEDPPCLPPPELPKLIPRVSLLIGILVFLNEVSLAQMSLIFSGA